MVKKLLKYDLAYLMRSIIPINIIIVVMALFIKIMQIVLADHLTPSYDDYRSFDPLYSLYSSVRGTFSLLIFVCCILTCMLVIIRFYKNLFTSEGYMSFTFPVTTSQHIWSKYLSAIIVTAITGTIMLLSEFLIDFKESTIYYFVKEMIDSLKNDPQLALTEILVVVLGIVFVLTAFLILFTCISLGQTFSGNRIAKSIVIFLAYFFVTFIAKVSIVTSLIFNFDFIEVIVEFFEKYITFIAPENIFLILYIIFKLAMGVVYYKITHNIIEKRLNLE